MDQLTRFAISNARFTWLLIATVTLAGVGVFLTQPLCGGLPPELAWPSMELLVDKVLPAVSGAAS